MIDIVSIYTDGGCLSHNPSSIGGTWAFCCVDANNKRIIEQGGYVLTQSESATNNWMEQIAIVLALESMPGEWSGILYSDSQIALGRVFLGWRTTNLPRNVIERTKKAIMRMGNIKPILLQGHPTKEDLINGYGKKRGLPVSEHNKWADNECRRQTSLFRHQLLLKELEIMNNAI